MTYVLLYHVISLLSSSLAIAELLNEDGIGHCRVEEIDEWRNWAIESQEAWEVFIRPNEELRFRVNEQRFYRGSIMRVLNASIPLNTYRLRALELRQLYYALEGSPGWEYCI